MERDGSSGNGTGNTGRSSRSSIGSGSRNSTESGSRNTGNGTGRSSRNGIGSGSRHSTGSGTGRSSRSTGNTGNGTGNGTGSGRAAPPGGAGWALLCLALLLFLLLPTPARALPTPAHHGHPTAESLRRSRELLEAASASLQRLKELGTLGFECTLEEVDPEDITENQINTIRACTAQDPGPGNCPTLERSTFDKGKCLQGISEDLRAYRNQLRNLSDPELLGTLDGMMEALGSSSTGKVPEAGPGSGPGTESGLGLGLGSGLSSAPFPERLRLCAVLQALRIRSITISRMLSFLSSL